MATLLPNTTRATSIETGGIEAIPASRRHGSPWQLISTWTAPNLEFATVFVGVIAVGVFGLGFWQAIAAIVLGSVVGSATQGILSTWGPREGLVQMVLGRTAFGYRGNILPAALNTVMAGIGWFAVNSVSGAFALAQLTSMPVWLALIIVVALEVLVAFIGHDLVQIFERYASIVLGVIFVIAVIVVFSHANVGIQNKGGNFSFAGFTLAAGAAFGYAAGWNPYASDYSRYLASTTNRVKIAWAAGLGNAVSCIILMAAGAASATVAGFSMDSNPTDSFTSSMPTAIAQLTLVAICVGAIAANALNIYSGSMSFLAAGIKIGYRLRRAIIAVGFGVIGFFVALAAVLNASFAANYDNFLLVIAYWITPWLAVVFLDRYLRRGTSIAALVSEKARYRNAAGIISFLIGLIVSVGLFSNQMFYTGILAKAFPEIGDLTALVGFVLSALAYLIFFTVMKPALGGPLSADESTVVGVDAADSNA